MKHSELPIFKKAIEIAETTQAIAASIEEQRDRYGLREQMLQNANLLGTKVAGAEGAGIYRIRMENAVLIKLAACELEAQACLCKVEGIAAGDYLALLRNELKEFKALFLSWVGGFDRLNNLDDGWGLFAD